MWKSNIALRSSQELPTKDRDPEATPTKVAHEHTKGGLDQMLQMAASPGGSQVLDGRLL